MAKNKGDSGRLPDYGNSHSSSLKLQHVDELLNIFHRILKFHHSSFFLYQESSKEIELISISGTTFKTIKKGDRVKIRTKTLKTIIEQGSYRVLKKGEKISDQLNFSQTKSQIIMPVKSDQDLIGILNLESIKTDKFNTDIIDILQKICAQIAYTVLRTELFFQKDSAHNLLLKLNLLSREVNSTFDLKKAINKVVKKLPDLISCRFCSLFFYAPDAKKLILMGHNSPIKDPLSSILDNDEPNTIMGRVISLKHSIIIKDIEQELNIPNNPKYKTKSFINILLKYKRKIIGVLNLSDKLDYSNFTTQEFDLLNNFANNLSTTIVNSEKYQNILELSITDGLTGLFVHRFFQESIASEISRSKRYDSNLSLIMMDIDDFKAFNDTFGHQVGDLVLRKTATLLKKEIRKHDIATRYGGEEFGIIMPNTSLNQALIIAERLREKIAANFIKYEGNKLRITVSIGITEYSPGLDKNEFIKKADSALLKAKSIGKNKVVHL